MLEHEQVWVCFLIVFLKCSRKENMKMSVIFEAMVQRTFLDFGPLQRRG